jgi:maleylacetoacetate isomerase
MLNLKLYNYFRSSTSYRVRIALELKNLSYQYIPVHLVNNGGEQNQEAYRKINPMGGVPTLTHTINDVDFVLSQSDAIIEYLDEAFPQTQKLFPIGIFQKAKVREFCQIINADIHSYGNLRTLQYLSKNLNADDSIKNKWIQDWFTIGLNACEKHLKSTSGLYCFGDITTAADCFLIPLVFTSNRFKIDLSEFKNVNRISENCLKLEAFQKAHPSKQVDTPDELRA